MGRIIAPQRAAKLAGVLFLLATVASCGASTPGATTGPAAPEAVAFADGQMVAESSTHGGGVTDTLPGAPGRSFCEAAWQEMTSDIRAAVGAEVLSAVSETEAVGSGCRTVVAGRSTKLTIVVESGVQASLESISHGRVGEDTLMGFAELGFAASDVRVASSLLHAELDYLFENRWFVRGSGSVARIEVRLEGRGAALREELLPLIEELEIAAQQARWDQEAAERLATVSESDAEAVEALRAIVQRVADTVVLDSLATDRGADAIAFEYAFPDNFAAISRAIEPDACVSDLHQSRCEVRAGSSSYLFELVWIADAWTLDGFAIESGS